MSATLIPNNGSRLQHDLARLTAAEAAALDIAVINRSRSPQQCDAHWLPWLAWERSIGDDEGWRFAETEQARRDLIGGYIAKHQHKGTPSVIRQLFRDLRLGEIDIIERVAKLRYNGEATFDGTHIFGGAPGDWAKYAIVVRRPITNEQANILRNILEQITPKRCELVYIDYRATALVWSGEITFNGAYNFGAA